MEESTDWWDKDMEKYNRQEHLAQLYQQRRNATRQKAEAAIARLLKCARAVNFNSVSQESGLTKTTLYNNADLRESIEKLRFQQSQLPTPAAMKHEMSEQSKDAIIDSLKRRIKILLEENKRLSEQVKMNYAEFYEKL